MMNLKDVMRSIEDFPQKGVIFRDITPILHDPKTLQEAVRQMQDGIGTSDFDLILGPESRGFIFGVPIAYNLEKGFVPVRKAGKLPYKTVAKTYDLEYGQATIEIHVDAIQPGDKVVIVDDLLATGGTTKAMIELVESMGGQVVKLVYLIELEFLKGRELLKGYDIHSVIQY
ncbi:adenine phosphoribosyltransferase [Lachnospiraceae bacterium oral taxon 500]|nr:adenine phosphoribosyltransferase [Lachnospiraceae bacterium oral taxon 500]